MGGVEGSGHGTSLDGTAAILIERISASHAIDLISHVGGRLPLHSSGVGKILLAHARPELVDQIIEQGLTAYTPRTITDPARLRQALDECRQTGVAVVHEETTPGADSVATRIMNANGDVVAALSVVVKTGSVNLNAVRPAVIAAGLAASRALGWTRPLEAPHEWYQPGPTGRDGSRHVGIAFNH